MFSGLPPKHADSALKETSSLSVSLFGTVTFSFAASIAVNEVELVWSSFVPVTVSTSAT